MRTPFLVLVAVFLLSLAACGDKATEGTAGGGNGSSSASGAQDGAESPEALIATLKAEFEKDDADMSALVPVVLPEHRGMLAFTMGLMAPAMAISMGEAMAGMGSPEDAEKNKAKFATMKSGFEDILKKHGIEGGMENPMGKLQQLEGDTDAAIAAMSKMFEGVDHAAFIKESMAFMKTMGSEGEGGMKPGADLKLEDVKIEIDGDTATATAPGEDQPLKLLKHDGRWYIDFVAMMKN